MLTACAQLGSAVPADVLTRISTASSWHNLAATAHDVGNPDQVYDKLNSVSNDKAPTVKNDIKTNNVVFNSLEFPTLGQTSDSTLFNFNTPNYGQVVKRTDRKDVKLESVTPTRPLKSSQILVDIPWVSTGDTLATSYFKHRETAIQVALERNKLFQR